MTITNDIRYIGVNDHQVDLFEGQYVVPKGMSYNSYAILDEKIAIMDTVDKNFTHEWLDNIQKTLGARKPDYLIVQHMEPDHAANIANFMKVYQEATIVSSAKAFVMMKNFFGDDFADRRIVVGEGDTLSLGKHTLAFVTAPMVHWPEVIVTYDVCDKVLFSADGFGKFGAYDAAEPWADEARRYFIGIVGKYGAQVQALLKKAAALDIQMICPLHGPVLKENLGYYINLYDIWSSYRVESEGIVIAYTSIYGNTKAAVDYLAEQLKANGCPKVVVYDLARCDMAQAVSDAFRYEKLVLGITAAFLLLFDCFGQKRLRLRRFRMIEYLLGGALLLDDAVRHVDDPVAYAARKLHLVRHHDHCAVGVLQLADHAENFSGQLRVERGRRLVKAQNIRRHRKRTRNRNSLALTARQLAGVIPHLLFQPHRADQLLCVFLDFRADFLLFFLEGTLPVRFARRLQLIQGKKLRRQRHVPQNRVLGKEIERLEHQPEMQAVQTDFLLRHLRTRAVNRSAGYGNLTVVRLFQKIQTPQKRRFSAPRRADDDEHLAPVQRKIDSFQNLVFPEVLTDIFDFKYCFRHDCPRNFQISSDQP